ncbi:MAG: LamG domain-containing protein [Candidatus Sumerlaeaceae bacterium]|nr:LamG domain-containing protein [Candidatus Sumerlaeaceae bacterium]
MKRLLGLLLGALLTVSSASAADVILYLNFDQAADGVYSDGTTYTIGTSEIANPAVAGLGTMDIFFRNFSGDGPAIGTLPGGLTGTAQGGKALLLNSGAGQSEGLQARVTNGLPLADDLTLEVIWWTNNPSGGSNTVGIQSPLGNEWPFGQRCQFFIRTVGATTMQWFSDRGDSNSERVTETTTIVANRLYHDVLVFDYNTTTPAQSQILAYRDGSLVGTSIYDASTAAFAFFSQGYLGQRRVAVGFANGQDANPSDHRGVSGGIDAVAISRGVRTPGNFFLPAGAPAAVKDWALFN